jgi:hypothetical protein
MSNEISQSVSDDLRGYMKIPTDYDSIRNRIGENTVIFQTTYTNGNLTQTKEFDVNNKLILQSDITYNADGTVNTITESINGRQFITTLHYVNGSIDSVNPITRSVV